MHEKLHLTMRFVQPGMPLGDSLTGGGNTRAPVYVVTVASTPALRGGVCCNDKKRELMSVESSQIKSFGCSLDSR